MRQVAYAGVARQDLLEITLWLSRESPRRARRAYDRIVARIDQLALNAAEAGYHPAVGPKLRRVLVYPYEIFFTLDELTVTVVGILHGARDLPSILTERGHG